MSEGWREDELEPVLACPMLVPAQTQLRATNSLRWHARNEAFGASRSALAFRQHALDDAEEAGDPSILGEHHPDS